MHRRSIKVCESAFHKHARELPLHLITKVWMLECTHDEAVSVELEPVSVTVLFPSSTVVSSLTAGSVLVIGSVVTGSVVIGSVVTGFGKKGGRLRNGKAVSIILFSVDPLSGDDVGGSLFVVVGLGEGVPDPFVGEEPDPLVLGDDGLFGAEPGPFLPFVEPNFLATLPGEEDWISRVVGEERPDIIRVLQGRQQREIISRSTKTCLGSRDGPALQEHGSCENRSSNTCKSKSNNGGDQKIRLRGITARDKKTLGNQYLQKNEARSAKLSALVGVAYQVQDDETQ
ncbi:hypothetical protein HETIRDRAFT_428514 [Heterobasidion irregulare TC 32-1]|uniref:Uncharacterized protein n=1 Tax=Heterobasidion irregulare (strain TC 32-1) TaxID=747525 RepID=W4JZW7_HETIT|nr:uncharacterized protein HETIRDRAFT_428514 [Heterobasidion irregulare TC 32-1]ETW78635.1 hypothetical protein HETIRDRAFT_428514 [Heterobasidion irregulare TC 32-1]